MKSESKIRISIIIVNYHVKNLLLTCINSIYKSTGENIKLEVIVVDNDEVKSISKDLKQRFPKTIYIPNTNRGFANGCNVGSKSASGDYLFFLNPDTIIRNDSIKLLLNNLERNKNTAIAAPTLYDINDKPYPLQGFGTLTPISAIFAFSLINKIFPGNPISKKYWRSDWMKQSVREVDSVPGSAFIIRKIIFQKIGGFDENFFLYFEEHDLCKRVKVLGYKIVMLSNAKVYHAWGESTKKSDKNISKIFNESRFYYLKKNYGLTWAVIVSFILSISTYSVILSLVILTGLFLRLFDISRNMTFIGDQAWFYLSARDIIVHGKFPLVGIASSHPWLHQGAFWTYLLAGALLVSNFNPVSGAYLAALLDCLAIFVIYKIGSTFFTKKVGIFASLVYATSPILVEYSKMPYHTSPIPLFTLLIVFFMLQWVVKLNVKALPVVLMLVVILYNFEIATSIFLAVIVFYITLGFARKKKYVKGVVNKKFALFSLLSIVTPMTPFIFYDLGHGFPQTLKFVLWIGYKILQFVGIFRRSSMDNHSYVSVFNFFVEKYENLLFPNYVISLALLVLSLVSAGWIFIRDKFESAESVIFLTGLISMVGYFAIKTPSDAYLPMIFPILLILFVLAVNKFKVFISTFYILSIVFLNLFIFVSSNNTTLYGLAGRIESSKQILKIAKGQGYNLVFKGPGQQFASSTANYEYLTWWLGNNPPITFPVKTKIYVIEGSERIKVINDQIMVK